MQQLVNAGKVAQAQTGGVAYLAHIGGFLFGVLIARLFIRWHGAAQESLE